MISSGICSLARASHALNLEKTVVYASSLASLWMLINYAASVKAYVRFGQPLCRF